MRGFGSPQVLFAQECQMEDLSRKLGIDPVEIRLKNALKLGSKTATGHAIEHSAGLIETVEKVREKIRQRIADVPRSGKEPGRRYIARVVSYGQWGRKRICSGASVFEKRW